MLNLIIDDLKVRNLKLDSIADLYYLRRVAFDFLREHIGVIVLKFSCRGDLLVLQAVFDIAVLILLNVVPDLSLYI